MKTREQIDVAEILKLLEDATPIQAFALGHLSSKRYPNPPPGGWTMAAMECDTWDDFLEFRRQLDQGLL